MSVVQLGVGSGSAMQRNSSVVAGELRAAKSKQSSAGGILGHEAKNSKENEFECNWQLRVYI